MFGCKLVAKWMYPLFFLLHGTINYGGASVEALCDVLKRLGKPIGHAVPVPISSPMPRSLRWMALNITLGRKVNHTWHFPRQMCACAWACLFEYAMQQWTWRLDWIESNGQQIKPGNTHTNSQYHITTLLIRSNMYLVNNTQMHIRTLAGKKHCCCNMNKGWTIHHFYI